MRLLSLRRLLRKPSDVVVAFLGFDGSARRKAVLNFHFDVKGPRKLAYFSHANRSQSGVYLCEVAAGMPQDFETLRDHCEMSIILELLGIASVIYLN